MGYDVHTLAFLFIIYSICGWTIESFYRSANAREFVNPGFLKGPYVPLYGTGAILILVVCDLTAGYSLTVRMAVYFLSISLLELLVGEAMLRLFGRRWWDYTDERFHIRGHVCPGFSLYWVVLALIFENTVYPVTMLMIQKADPTAMHRFTLLLSALMAADAIYSTGIPGKILNAMRDSIVSSARNGLARDFARARAAVQISLLGGWDLRIPGIPRHIPGRASRVLAKFGKGLHAKIWSTVMRNDTVRSFFSRGERP